MKRFLDAVNNHPHRSIFICLALGMVAILLIAARDVPLSAGQRFTVVVSTVTLAALCTWIIQWEKGAV